MQCPFYERVEYKDGKERPVLQGIDMGMVTPILLCYIFKTFLNGVCSVMDNTLIGNRENELNTG